MLSAKYRLTKNDFKLIKNVSCSVFSSESFLLKVIRSNFSFPRFAVVVSSSVSKKATKRNLLKRRVRAVFFKYLRDIKKGLIIVVYAKKTAVAITFDDINKELATLFKKAKILNLNKND